MPGKGQPKSAVDTESPVPQGIVRWLRRATAGRRQWLGVALLLAVFSLLVVGAARHQSVTVDEFHLVPQAIVLRATGDLDLGMKTPPLLKRWVGLAVSPGAVVLPSHRVNGRPAQDGWEPWEFGTRFMEANREHYRAIFLRARLMMLPLGWLLGLSIFLWARAVGGSAAGWVALTLFAFSPEMIAFTSLVSLDLAVTALLVPGLYLLRRALVRRHLGWLTAAATSMGLALAVKLPVVVILPLLLVPVAALARDRAWRRAAAALAIVVLVPPLVLHATYGFDRPLVSPGELRPQSGGFQMIQRLWPAALPIPAPRAWLAGMDLQAKDAGGDVPSYLDGEWSNSGWRSYYLRAFAYKSPLPLLALLALLALWSARRRPRIEPVDGLLILVPMLLWGGLFALAAGLNIGIRYVLPCYALLYVGVGLLVARLKRKGGWRGAALALVGCFALASLLAWPHHLSYFNAIAGGPDRGYRHLADSNLDWGQELAHLGAYLRDQGIERIGLAYFGHVDPAIHGIDYFVPTGRLGPGWYAISANYLVGYPYPIYDHGRIGSIAPGHFIPFAQLEPVATLGGALMIYRVEE